MAYKTERQMLAKTLLKDGDYQSTKEAIEKVGKMMPNVNLLAELDEKDNIVYHTASEVLETVEALGDGMLASGFEDKHISIIAENSYRYVITDLAIAGGVGVVTPIDKDANEELLTTLLNRCDADAIVCSAYLIEKLNKVLKDCKNVKTLITIDKKIDGYLCYDELVELGKKAENAGKYRDKKLDREKVCEILFTSGTTGLNKGVELTQKNLSANIMNCLNTIKGENTNNTSMSILPMHHATEINTHIFPRIAAGRLTYINTSLKDMMRNIKIFKPYVITVVPMVANAFYKNIWQQAKKQGKEELLKKGIKICKLCSLFGIDITHKLFKDLYVPFGGNLKQIVCGGAPLNPEVVKGLRDLGIFIINGYGITECGPLVSMNTDTVHETYSIGKPCDNLEIKLADKDEEGVGELCVKGESVSKRYYKDEESTKLVHDEDGFFHTGDLVRIDSKGRMFLAGRKKNLIVLANGKNVYPEELETLIVNNIGYIKEVVVFEGKIKVKEEKDEICALIYLDSEKGEKSNDEIIADFRKFNQTLPPYKRIGYVEVVDTEFEKNASRKIIKKPALERHKEQGGLII